MMAGSSAPGRSPVFGRLQAGVARFPVPALLAFMAAGVSAYTLLNAFERFQDVLASLTAFFCAMAAALWLEGRLRPAAARLIPLAAAALTLLWIITRPTIELAAATGLPLIAAGAAAVTFALTRPGRLDRAAGWGALREDMLSAVFALAVAFAACIGVSAALGLISLLVDDMAADLFALVWCFGMIFGAPLIWFARKRPLEAALEPAGAIYRGIALWLLGPLTVVYLVTLHLLALRLFPDLQLPDGATGWVVAPFLAVAAVTLHALSGLAHTPLLARILYWSPAATLAPAAVMLIAADERIDAYGLTEPRIFLALLGLWALATTLGGYIWRPLHGVRAQACVLAATLTLAAFAASPLAIHSQSQALDMLTDGSAADQERIRDVARFLEDRAALGAQGTARAETAAAAARTVEQSRRQFCGVEKRRIGSVAIDGFSRRLYSGFGGDARFLFPSPITFIPIGEGRLRFETDDGVTGVFNLANVMDKVVTDCLDAQSPWLHIDDATRRVESEDGRAMLLIEELEARRANPSGPWRLDRVGGELFLK